MPIAGWQPLTRDTPAEIFPRNCLVRVTTRGLASRERQQRNASHSSQLGAKETGDNGGDVVLALPWRRFGGDLGRDGFAVAGRRAYVGDVSNSDKGTGLFTWVRCGRPRHLWGVFDAKEDFEASYI